MSNACSSCPRQNFLLNHTKRYELRKISQDVEINSNQTNLSDFNENCQKRLYRADHKGQTVSPAIKRAAADQRGAVWSLGRRDLPQTGLRFRLKVKQQWRRKTFTKAKKR